MRIALFSLVMIVVIAPPEHAQSQEPLSTWNVSEWKTWRDGQIHSILAPTYPADAPKVLTRQLVIERSAEVKAALDKVLAGNGDYFAKNDALNAEMKNFISFVRAQAVMKDTKHELGFTVTDQEYFKYASEFLIFPEFLRSQSFLDLMSDSKTYEKALTSLQGYIDTLPESNRWLFLPFEAQFIKSIPDEGHGRTYGRLVIFVPGTQLRDGSTLDRWFLFSLATPDQPNPGTVRPVSLVSVQRIPGTAERPVHMKVYFMDFIREKNKTSGGMKLTPTALSNLSDNCFDCHKSALIPIRPRHEFEFVGGELMQKQTPNGKVSAALNTTIKAYREYGVPDWGYIDLAAYGPSIGQAGINRTDEFFAKATKGLDLNSSSYDKLRAAMNCAECHDRFAPLNYLLAVPNERDISGVFRRHESIIKTNIVEGWMPPDSNLTSVQREALYRCLTAEYADLPSGNGALFEWLRGKKPCY